ncbi:hypothetical protein Godav_025162 [Gossypium davidsonii]|uniref:Uncharacterized protein n=1 Tax=Gossypium davidsonii TaxID=34287 RepID=A0A7J8TJ27_GOSDV|nr:hypothetical protein [Gossypium davidsonii]
MSNPKIIGDLSIKLKSFLIRWALFVNKSKWRVEWKKGLDFNLSSVALTKRLFSERDSDEGYLQVTIELVLVKEVRLETLRGLNGLNLCRLKKDIQPWLEQRSAEYMTHASLGSLNSIGGIATEINAINYVYPRSWFETLTAPQAGLAVASEGPISPVQAPVRPRTLVFELTRMICEGLADYMEKDAHQYMRALLGHTNESESMAMTRSKKVHKIVHVYESAKRA